MTKTYYQTKQMQVIKDFLLQNKNVHLTALDICNALTNQGISIGTTTVYRQLEKLVQSGDVCKYQIDTKTPACFEYVGTTRQNEMLIHCKCTICNKVFHLNLMDNLKFFENIKKDINFSVDLKHTVLYGTCANCQKED